MGIGDGIDKKDTARKHRGQVEKSAGTWILGLSNNELMQRLQDPIPSNRTAAARLLGKRRVKEAISCLCDQLVEERSLYPRLAICEALVDIGTPALPGLVGLLGKIGHNQHTSLPDKGFNKKSYPLPRDLAARAIIRLGVPALPLLEEVLDKGERIQQIEAVDAIGYIAFYHKDYRSEPVLLDSYRKRPSDLVLRWKIVRAFQSYPSEVVRGVLGDLILNDEQPEIRWEAVRSLGQHHMDVPESIGRQARQDVNLEVRRMADLFLPS